MSASSMSQQAISVAAVYDRRRPGTAVIDRRYSAPLLLGLVLFVLPVFLRAETSEPAPLAAKALLLDIAKAGDNLVAVGDHGHVVISADDGKTWTQSLTPTRALLTGVSFPDSRHGWAVGHDGVIIATNDGGRTWSRQDEGESLDTVFLDVLFRDAQRGFAVGAYGKFLATGDGGKTWSAAQPSPDEVHYNCISEGPDDYLYLAGESGTTLVSNDGGKSWRKSQVPYDGSLFGILPVAAGRILAYGLRGHILRSEDQGGQWEPINTSAPILIMGGARLGRDVILLGGQGGNFFVSRNAGRSFTAWKPANFGTSIAELVEANDGAIVVVGEAGATRLTLP
ncbi:MAG: hypothetical protein JWQ83_24 [Lacunisphaera sp.]|nr:hypothetical protein [Lacunisphaera sp.]